MAGLGSVRYFHNTIQPVLDSVSGWVKSYVSMCPTFGDITILLLLTGVRSARPGESENTLSVRRPQPHTINPRKEEKDKIVGDKKERADHANRNALALLLKPGSLTPSNTGSLRSFQRDREGHNKGPAIRRSPTTRRRERVPI